jgi:hypothetical protein
MSERDRFSTTANTSYICCPFFVAHSKNEIMCEGLIDGTKQICAFKNQEEKTWHKKNYCEKGYTRCEVYCSIKHWQWPEEE